jgi:hypothetical protein
MSGCISFPALFESPRACESQRRQIHSLNAPQRFPDTEFSSAIALADKVDGGESRGNGRQP